MSMPEFTLKEVVPPPHALALTPNTVIPPPEHHVFRVGKSLKLKIPAFDLTCQYDPAFMEFPKKPTRVLVESRQILFTMSKRIVAYRLLFTMEFTGYLKMVHFDGMEEAVVNIEPSNDSPPIYTEGK